MNDDEVKQYHELMQRVEDGGNDGADIYDATEFMRGMERKYQLPFDMLKGHEWKSQE